MEKIDYVDRAVIRLKRKYNKDELVNYLLKKIHEKDTELGRLDTKIKFLEKELKNSYNQKEITRLAKIEARKEELYNTQVKKNNKQRKEIKELRLLRDKLISKNHELQLILKKH